ncbi:hypothetical protein Pla22_11550 [Rubripirellula amarantea]|uniref:Uncharacterized protein n=1 Tax=Rubripirellula amarantea TaxID=2527999 RepID=A0A5C5WRT3_9BACT|nr:hypothetical protein Pla22_11550 [Rubripirellula amarantea]
MDEPTNPQTPVIKMFKLLFPTPCGIRQRLLRWQYNRAMIETMVPISWFNDACQTDLLEFDRRFVGGENFRRRPCMFEAVARTRKATSITV